MTVGAFYGRAFNGFGFNIGYDASFSITETGLDVAAFAITPVALVTLEVTEQTDTTDFYVRIPAELSFSLTEAADTADIEAELPFILHLAATEAADQFDAETISLTNLLFSVSERTDYGALRAFSAFITDGDADYMYVPSEHQTIVLPPSMDRSIIFGEPMDARLPFENKSINVAQVRAHRKGDQ